MSYNTSVAIDRRISPFKNPEETELKKDIHVGKDDEKKGTKASYSYYGKGDANTIKAPKSIINQHNSFVLSSIYNTYRFPGDTNAMYDFMYDDFRRGMGHDVLQQILDDAKNPTIMNIMKWYSTNPTCAYKETDFVYLKYINKIPLNRMITLRRYPFPCSDKMFILGVDNNGDADYLSEFFGYPKKMTPIATAVTFASELAGNNIQSILGMSYNMKWKSNEADVQTIQRSGLDSQSRNSWVGKHSGSSQGKKLYDSADAQSAPSHALSHILTAGRSGINAAMRGKDGQQLWADKHLYQGDKMMEMYGSGVFGPINAITSTQTRERGLEFSHSFELRFTYSLKAVKYVNPKSAMLDIISNFLILTGNYGQFWGGMTRYFTPRGDLGPEFGDVSLLRSGNFYEYFQSAKNDVNKGLKTLTDGKGATWEGAKTAFKKVAQIGLSDFIGNMLGKFTGGEMVQNECLKALLSGRPTGYWHVTIGNPLNPIAVMGNMIVKDTKIEFSNVLGEDDFPNEVSFIVSLEHGQPRDVGGIQQMFNNGTGRTYVDADPVMMSAMNRDDRLIAYIDPNPEFKYEKFVTTPTINTGYKPDDWGSIGDATNEGWSFAKAQASTAWNVTSGGANDAWFHLKQSYNNYKNDTDTSYGQYVHEGDGIANDIAVKTNTAAIKASVGG